MEDINRKYEHLSVELIEEVLKDLVDSRVYTERKFKVLTGCSTNGFTDLELDNLCSDPECKSCSSFREAIKEEATRWKK